jgi:HPt (histidine-containing phosphotransfer) domain-containing protein
VLPLLFLISVPALGHIFCTFKIYSFSIHEIIAAQILRSNYNYRDRPGVSANLKGMGMKSLPVQGVESAPTALEEGTANSAAFDLPGTLKRLGGDQRILTDLVKMFVEDSPALFQRLSAGVEAGNANQIQHAAHSLRGLASNFGAAPLIRPLQEMEELAAQNQLKTLHPLIQKVQREIARLETVLEPYVIAD